jgi:molecular chaperone GrpE
VTDDGRTLADENPPTVEDAAEHLLEDEAQSLEIVEAHDLEVEPSAEELGLELPDDADEARVLLLRELAEARREAGEYLETLQRVAADFDNYRKRVERDHAENVMRASQRIVEHLLPTLDAFDAALAYESQTEGEEKILDGMRGTHRTMMETLAKDGLEPIAANGEAFDPAVHEAVAGPGEGDGDLVVTQELRRGYTLHDRVVRPSLVMVGHADLTQ